MILYPNAKVNIGLNIINKRVDGYHDIETLFYPIKGLYDILEIVEVEGEQNRIEFSQSGNSTGCSNEHNLCVKAYNLMMEAESIPAVKMHLHKQIPIGAGLGGGSADGAFAIKGLNQLLGNKIDDVQLHELALKVGSDCPFFLYNTPMLACGRGEKLEVVTLALAGYWLLLVNPGIHVSTGSAYAKTNPEPWIPRLRERIAQQITGWRGSVRNDFEKTVFTDYPEIEVVKQQLYDLGAIYASMSGSGSTVYGLFASKPDIKNEFKNMYLHVEELQ
ncbi:MAG TPA: 4-(cytidine 5'-diphospho)-2-C-methyl-D-erythritol kinase [Tenuifilaceae bacterium]|nr:4-(cytidine 5'-diphospho)-2-C-methyl-D-erythritol kinase [Tenuifilaceae bacterium]